MIICVGGIKGGGGKTTVATNLAIMRAGVNAADDIHVITRGDRLQIAEAEQLGYKRRDVLLVDADEQATSSDFTQLRTERLESAGYTCIQLGARAVLTETVKLRPKYDDIVIDTGGRDTTSQRAAMAAADLLLVPFVPRSFDIWTLERVAALVEEMRQANPSLAAWMFLNRADPRGEDNASAAELLRETSSLQYVDCGLGNRKAFANAAAKGLGVCEDARDSKACDEMRALYTRVFTREGKRNGHRT